MNPRPGHTGETAPLETPRRLLLMRLALLAGEVTLLAAAALGIVTQLPWPELVTVLLLHGGLAVVAAWRLRAGRPSEQGVLFAELAGDAAVVAALVYFTGGYANPFISLLLVPLIVCAVVLRPRHAWAMSGWVAVLYSLLAAYYQPLRLDLSAEAAIHLHLVGMWLNFLLTALLVTVFVGRLAAALRAREAELARSREQALRDEQLFALGMQAAAAAHDLSTPLSSLMVTIQELQREYVGDDELDPSLALMRGQLERMRVVLSRLAAAAGAARAGGVASLELDAWLEETFAHWQLMRPQAQASLRLEGPRPAPTVRDEPILVSLLATLLNNAADASPAAVELLADWRDGELTVTVLDRGPGLAGGSGKDGGWGVGLTLAEAALERFAGHLNMTARPGGGLAVGFRLPLARLAA